MNYGQTQAVMVLVGERMGFEMPSAELSKKVLAGGTIHQMHHAAIEREAVDLNNRLRVQPDLIAQANNLSSAVISEFGLN